MAKHKKIQVFLAIIFLFNICAATFCFPEDISSYPQRIVSLGPGITEQLYLLGVEDKLVGLTSYCRRPPRAQRKEKVGTVLEVNLEKIVYLQPGLVLATSLTNPKTIEKLKSLGIKVAHFPQAKNFSQLCKQFLELGRIVGKKSEAQQIVRQAKMKVELVKKEIKDLPKQEVFVQIGTRPLFAATSDSFINDFIEFAGGINIACDSKSGIYSREKVLEDNPEVIIITSMGIGGEEKKLWRNFKALNAVKNDRIYIVDSDKFCSPTPLSFVEALEEMVKILHPDAPR